MGTIVITGSAGGIGQATRERLALDGHEVIGVDIRDAEVIADLSTPEGRTEMVGAVAAASGGRIDGLVETCLDDNEAQAREPAGADAWPAANTTAQHWPSVK